MDFSSVIRTDNDRLFHVDEECYIICTGDSTEDEHPFIRIGNWEDMPAKLIPLIKNIVITDSLTGNPGCERFNIDPRHPEAICYIGSEEAVKPYIKFQKLFGLDLSKSGVIDIKKDIPELSNEKNLSDDDQFIGVFYKDGSFKTVHNGNTILELKEANGDTEQKEAGSEQSLFSDTGFVVQNGNPIFFHKGIMLSYLTPPYGFNLPKNSERKIKAIIYPSEDYQGLSSFLKQRGNVDGTLTVFSNKPEDIRTIQKLFRKIQIKREDFDKMKWLSPSGMMAEKYPNSPNIKLTFPDGFSIAFAKSHVGVQHILKDCPDLLLIEYSAYMQSVLLFKSVQLPVAVINDTKEDISIRLTMNLIPLQEDTVYRIVKKEDTDSRISVEDTDDILTCSEKELPAKLDAIKSKQKIFNAVSLLKMRLNSAIKREQYKSIAELYSDFSHPGLVGGSIIDLLFKNGNAYEFTMSDNGRPLFDTIGKIDIYIEKDRRRLAELLALFENRQTKTALGLSENKESKTEKSGANDTYGLDRYRKVSEKVAAAAMPLFESVARIINKRNRAAAKSQNSSESAGTKKTEKTDIWNTLKAHPLPLGILAIILGVFIALIAVNRSENSDANTVYENNLAAQEAEEYGSESNNVVPSSEVPSSKKLSYYNALPKEFKSDITDNDIYRYVNLVAIKNGYRKLSEAEMKSKNPNRIFPKDTFKMLDEQTVTVAEGDTLWNLAKRKLMELDIVFYEVTEQLKKANGPERTDLLEKAKNISFTKRHEQILDTL